MSGKALMTTEACSCDKLLLTWDSTARTSFTIFWVEAIPAHP